MTEQYCHATRHMSDCLVVVVVGGVGSQAK